MLYKDKEEYIRYKLSKNFKLGHVEDGEKECPNPEHLGSEIVGSFVHHEAGFTEYDSACALCLQGYKEFLEKEFENAAISIGGFRCEDCGALTPYLIANNDGTVEDGLHVHKDVDDNSLTDCCHSCFRARKQKDQEYLSYEEDLYDFDED